MILPKPEDAYHKSVMYRLLIHILDDQYLSSNLYFKGGTCASILGWLDRFSVDLDFDLKTKQNKLLVEKKLRTIFNKLQLSVKSQAKDQLFYVLKYEAVKGKRNNLKLSIVDDLVKSNRYNSFYLAEIDRYGQCQTRETMFANKLVALIDRYDRYKVIAGRDLYDIHHFFKMGYDYTLQVIEERRKISVKAYLKELIDFIDKKITRTIIEQDLNYLLTPEKFLSIRDTLKQETLIFLRDEIKRLEM